MTSKDTRYWDGVAREWVSERRQGLWRDFCDRINRRLMRQVTGLDARGRGLKTDLFDEVTGTVGLIPELARGAEKICGIDLSPISAGIARQRHASLGACAADVRWLPFADRSFDFVLSNSTLDHMESLDDISTALAEIWRVMTPRGVLLLTLDNLANPLIALRNILPHRLLTVLRLVPYYVGATCGPRKLRQLIEAAGFEIEQLGATMHCPRLPAVAIASLLDRWGSERFAARYSSSLMGWEVLERLPTRYLTGYFIHVLARRS